MFKGNLSYTLRSYPTQYGGAQLIPELGRTGGSLSLKTAWSIVSFRTAQGIQRNLF